MDHDGKKKWTSLLGASLLFGSMTVPFFTSVHSVFAATTEEGSLQAVVSHAAYLKTSPHLGIYNEIELLTKGTVLHIIRATRFWLYVRLDDGAVGFITANPHYITWAPPFSHSGIQNSTVDTVAINSNNVTSTSYFPPKTTTAIPPGVTLDPNMHPIAPLSASYAEKLQAIEEVAQSKLGTPYIWGHNEDRGQYGFDCSNFVEYVFHEALGYNFSGSSRVQFEHVGWPIPIHEMRPGDELFFSDRTNPTGSAHVGIYIGHGEMIEEGGGLGKVGYLSIDHGFWSRHLVAVHRLF